MQLGKFDSDRDSALHYLCTQDWSTGSFGDVDSPTGYVWRISNTAPEVQLANTEITSVLEEFLQHEEIEDSAEFRASLIGHYLLREDSNGFVYVLAFASMADRDAIYSELAREYDAWADAMEDDV